MKAQIKKFMTKAFMFAYGVVGIMGVIFFITGAVRCCIHFMENTTPTFPEYLGLITVILISGIAGIAVYECEIDTDE